MASHRPLLFWVMSDSESERDSSLFVLPNGDKNGAAKEEEGRKTSRFAHKPHVCGCTEASKVMWTRTFVVLLSLSVSIYLTFCWRRDCWSSSRRRRISLTTPKAVYNMGLSLSAAKRTLCISESATCRLPRVVVDNAASSSSSNMPSIMSENGRNSDKSNPLPNEFVTGRIVHIENEAKHLKRISIEVPAIVAQSYRHPGQYLQIRAKRDPMQENEHKAFYFAILSPPIPNFTATINNNHTDTAVLSFLIKETTSNAFLFQLSDIDISTAMGKGFVLPRNLVTSVSSSTEPPPDLLLVATGTGISPIASYITSILLSQQRSSLFRNITLLLGVRSPAHIPLVNTLISWCQVYHIHIIFVFSQPPEFPISSDGLSDTSLGQAINISSTIFPCVYGRYVQDVLGDQWTAQLTPSSSHLTKPDTRNQEDTVVLVCGQAEMDLSVKELCVARGIEADNIVSNVPITMRTS